MTEMLIYQKPVLLTREQHSGLRFKPYQDFSFAAGANAVPLTGVEFFEASRDYAILFNKDPRSGEYFPLALMSLKRDRNLQIDEQGQWQNGYIPAFVRRYPFAHTSDNKVCFDESSSALGTDLEDGEPLFNGKEETETLKNVIRFVQDYNEQSRRTREFCAALQEAELLKPYNVQLTRNQQPAARLEGLYIVDERKLMELDDAKLVAWLRKGWIAWCYAHLHSQGSLLRMLNALKPDPEDKAAEPAAASGAKSRKPAARAKAKA